MDDSLIFDFSGSVPDDHNEESFLISDHNSYETLLTKTKDAFNGYQIEIKRLTFPSYFTSSLQNCQACIKYSLENAGYFMDKNEVQRAVDYLNDTINMLQMLIEHVKHLVEAVTISCFTMESFPTKTGEIIFSVFMHCRDSESIYGSNLKSFEKQLKDLFRICHNLQLTYLMVLEKQFTFDFTQEKDKTVLLDAIKVNLDIGEVVQSLDVKTMAEQWKGYTLICEKYSQELCEFDIVFQESAEVLCKLIKENLTTVENCQDDKVIVRSLKVTSFTMKILIKICNIFRRASHKNYNSILELLQCIYLTVNNSSTLEKSVVSLLHANVVIPSDSLLKELLSEEEFVSSLVTLINNTNENDNSIALVLVISSAMKCSTQLNKKDLKTRLIECVYRILSHNSSILQKRITKHNIFTHLLIHTCAMALTLTSAEYSELERRMIVCVLSTEYISALFSILLWVSLARHTSQLLFNQLIWLCTMYKKLINHEGFNGSPQNIFLSHLLSLLFKSLDDENRLKICKQFRVHDDDNMRLWTAVQIRNIPLESVGKAEEAIVEKLKNVTVNLRDAGSPDDLINITNLASTCDFKNARGIAEYAVKAWLRACQDSQPVVLGMDKHSIWFYDYLKALVALTETILDQLMERSDNLVRVLHVIHGLIRTGDSEMKLILCDLLCKLASYETTGHKNSVDSHLTEAFMTLIQDSEDTVRNNLFLTLKCYKQNIYIDNMISNIVSDNEVLQDIWENINGNSLQILNPTASYSDKYTHKCLIDNAFPVNIREVTKTLSEKSMDFLEKDIIEDGYLDSAGSEIEEPSRKRGKPNFHEADVVIDNLEENVALLEKQNVYASQQLVRIRNICEKLKNISQ